MLADYLYVMDLKTAWMDAIFPHFFNNRTYMSTEAVCKIFRAFSENDPLLQLAVDAFCINNVIHDMDGESLDYDLPKEYLARVMRKLHQLSQVPEKEREYCREDYSMIESLPNASDGGQE